MGTLFQPDTVKEEPSDESLGMFGKHSRNIQGTLREYSRKIQGRVNIQGTFRRFPSDLPCISHGGYFE
jgi:hypothetical protein